MDIPEGKYLVNICGYARKNPVKDTKEDANYGYQFEFVKVDKFKGYKNPRTDEYTFCIQSTLENRK